MFIFFYYSYTSFLYSISLQYYIKFSLWSWGYNLYGQLGLSDNVQRSSPVQVGALSDWSQIKTGFTHTTAIKTNGTLWAWGEGVGYGILGIIF